MGISESRLSVLRKDPLFDEAYWNLLAEINEKFVSSRMDAMEILQETAVDAALVAREAVTQGTMSGEEISPALRTKNVWNVLKATGATQEQHTIDDLADAIVRAYEDKYKERVVNVTGEVKQIEGN